MKKNTKKQEVATPKIDYSKPADVSALDMAFPASVIGRLLPPMSQIPETFDNAATWRNLTSSWFFSGLKGTFIPKPGIDVQAAKRHLGACLGSYEPKHEHKEEGVAYLMSLWFERFEPTVSK